VFLDPPVVGRARAGEDEARELDHAIQRRTERRLDLRIAFLPWPQPHRVDVGVADHADANVVGHRGYSSVSSPRNAPSARSCFCRFAMSSLRGVTPSRIASAAAVPAAWPMPIVLPMTRSAPKAT